MLRRGSQGVRIPLAPFVHNVHNVQYGPSGGDPADEWPLAKIRDCESFFATLEGELLPGQTLLRRHQMAGRGIEKMVHTDLGTRGVP